MGLRAISPKRKHETPEEVCEDPEDDDKDGIFLDDAADDVVEDNRLYIVCGTQGRECGLNTCQRAHVGTVHFETTGWYGQSIRLLYCSGTGEIINHKPLLEYYKLDVEKHRRLAWLQMVYPRLLPPYSYSDDSDAEDHGLERAQPETTAILANLMPGCNRYFLSGCHDVLQWWCRFFVLRFLFCFWADWVGEEYGRKCGGIDSPIMDAIPPLLQ